MSTQEQEFDWTGLGEISGFGGTYEAACRAMTKAGVEYLRANPDKMPAVGERYLSELRNAVSREHEGATGAMVGAACSHAIFIINNGWEEYARQMSERA